VNSDAPPILPPILPGEATRGGITLSAPDTGARARLWRAWMVPVQFAWGMIFCQSLLGSMLVVGWSYRLARRFALKEWWRQSPLKCRPGLIFKDFLAADEETAGQRNWPNWFLGPPAARAAKRGVPGLLHRIAGSLHENLRLGLQGIANTSVLVLPACLFWWFGWYDGWNNSFNKGYEHAAVGPVISVLGILLFIGAMFYVPLAQARQAVTGRWRSFYDVGVVWSVLRARWLSSLGLALLYSLLALPLNVLKTWPMFQPQVRPEFEALTDAQAAAWLHSYFFWCGALMFPAYVLLRLLAAKIYAGGLLAALQRGAIPFGALAENERATLQRLELASLRPPPSRHRCVRLIAFTGTLAGQLAAAFVACWIWFSFVAQIYVAEFFSYHTALGWVNQPLVQFPWFHYLPPRLGNLPGEVLLALVGIAGVAVVGVFRRSRRRAGVAAAAGK
jgi:hypothetical protein